jgi:uncharacterized protein (DUF2252 family)
MPLEHQQADVLQPVAARRQAGHALRKLVPRSLHAAWTPAADRRDPVQVLIESGLHRIPSLLPIRYGRMRVSPFSFLRGAAAIMAADLAGTPSSGLVVQSCGDCHHLNFGTFLSPEGVPVFDVNDFDETLPAPFEWDLKRLAASFAVDGRARGLAERTSRDLARASVQAYRLHMGALLRLDPWAAWTSRIEVLPALAQVADDRLRGRLERRLHLVLEANKKGWPKLLERRRGHWRLREKPPLMFSLTEQADDTHAIAARAAFASYRATLPEERRLLIDRYRLEDVAFKVVGVGSVGTFCAVGLYVTPDDDTLLLQIKEAQASALEPYAGRSLYANQGRRVVTGQRIMQTNPDVFLGWTQDPGDDRHCYVRELKDPRLALVGNELADAALPVHAVLCGRALARAHARSGDAARIAGYLGSGGVMDGAVADFAMSYADQTERDWRLFLEAIKSGQIEAAA